MKKILISLLTAVMIGSTLTACTSKADNGQKVEQGSKIELTMSAADMVNKMGEAGYVPMPIIIDETEAKEVYGINDDVIEEYGIAKAGRMPGIGFIMIVKAKEGKATEAKAIVDKVLEDQIANAFYPDEKEAAEKGKVEVKGDYVSLFILYDDVEADAVKMYEDSFKK